MNNNFKISVVLPFRPRKDGKTVEPLKHALRRMYQYPYIFSEILISHVVPDQNDSPMGLDLLVDVYPTIPTYYLFKRVAVQAPEEFVKSGASPRTPAHAINLGINESASDCDAIFLYTLGCVPARAYIEDLRDLHERYGLLFPKTIDSLEMIDSPPYSTGEEYFNMVGFKLSTGTGWAGCSFKKKDWETVGGYDEDFIGYHRDDVDFGYRLSAFPIERTHRVSFLAGEHGINEETVRQYEKEGTLNVPLYIGNLTHFVVIVPYPGKSTHQCQEKLDDESYNKKLFTERITQLKRNPSGTCRNPEMRRLI